MANVPTLMHHDIIPNLQSHHVAKEKQLERTVERGDRVRMWVENEDVSVDDAIWILTGEIVGVLWQR